MKTLFCTRYRVQILLKNQHFSVSAHCGMGTCKPKAFCTPGVSLGSEGFLCASASKRVLESHRPEEIPEIARHLRCPEVIFSYISSPLLLSERLRPNSREEQEQRKSSQAVPLLSLHTPQTQRVQMGLLRRYAASFRRTFRLQGCIYTLQN